MTKQTIITCVLFLMFNVLSAQDVYRVQAYEVSINGTSSLHDWTSTAKQVRATAQLQLQEGQLKGIPAFKVEIPVKQIKSEKGRIMDNKTYDALKAEAYPTITFQLLRVTSLRTVGGETSIEANGRLTIAGKSKVIPVSATAKWTGAGELQLKGSKKLLMTDYGIDPPTALLGTLKTGDEIEIKYELTLALEQPSN